MAQVSTPIPYKNKYFLYCVSNHVHSRILCLAYVYLGVYLGYGISKHYLGDT
jgi:hypothetical protein